MTDEPTDTRPEPDEDRDETELVLPAILGRNTGREDAGGYLHPKFEESLGQFLVYSAQAAVVIFGKAYIESLAKHAGDATDGLLKRMRVRWRRRTREHRLGVGEGAATVVITEDLPDEARLALLDLDVTAPELRGRELVWDSAAGEWRPSEGLSAEPG